MNGDKLLLFRVILASIVMALPVALLASCGGASVRTASWEDDPIVPGYSVAEINIGDKFSTVMEVHGDPDERRRDGGYQIAYYHKTREGGNLDDPDSWRIVITLYDNGNDYLDGEDEVGAVEISAPYTGLTSGGVGLGSTPQEVEAEFGPCENVTSSEGPKGERLQLYSYTARGVDFLFSERKEVITVIVTAYGGLRSVQEKGGEFDAQGGLFGVHQTAPIIPGQSGADINIGDEFRTVKEKYGSPDSSGSTTDGLVYATYTGGYGSWKLNLYLEDLDKNGSLGDFDSVVSIGLRHPYAGKTPKGVGIGSTQADVVKEFGAPQRESTIYIQGEETKILEYNTRGIVFALSMPSTVVKEIDVNRPLVNTDLPIIYHPSRLAYQFPLSLPRPAS
jgi:hypothetical protein